MPAEEAFQNPQRFKGYRFNVQGSAQAPAKKSGQSNHQETVPFWHSSIRAPPLAASVQSDRKRNFEKENIE